MFDDKFSPKPATRAERSLSAVGVRVDFRCAYSIRVRSTDHDLVDDVFPCDCTFTQGIWCVFSRFAGNVSFVICVPLRTSVCVCVQMCICAFYGIRRRVSHRASNAQLNSVPVKLGSAQCGWMSR